MNSQERETRIEDLLDLAHANALYASELLLQVGSARNVERVMGILQVALDSARKALPMLEREETDAEQLEQPDGENLSRRASKLEREHYPCDDPDCQYWEWKYSN